MKLTEARIKQIIKEELEAFNEAPLEEADQLDLTKLAPLADKAAQDIMKSLEDMSLKAANGDEGVAAAVKKVVIAKLSAEG